MHTCTPARVHFHRCAFARLQQSDARTNRKRHRQTRGKDRGMHASKRKRANAQATRTAGPRVYKLIDRNYGRTANAAITLDSINYARLPCTGLTRSDLPRRKGWPRSIDILSICVCAKPVCVVGLWMCAHIY